MMITRVRLTAAEPIDLGYGLVAQAGTYDGERRVSGQQINSSHKLDQYFILRIGNNSNIDVTKFVNDGQLTVT